MPKEPLAFVLGGGIGKRLYPLTRDRAKPAMPFGGNYRVIDFVLSNLLHSKIKNIYVLTQYEPRSLEDHIFEGWVPLFGTGKYHTIRLLPAKQGGKGGWYFGTADAINQNKRYIRDKNPSMVNIFGGDHIYLMDISQMNDFHHKTKADLTISAIPVEIGLASQRYGILVINKHWELIDFEEKPENPTPMPKSTKYCITSMGNYTFNPEILLEELAADDEKTTTNDRSLVASDPDHYSSHDFGFDIIPAMLRKKRKIFLYNFKKNIIPGLKENQKGYWRDIGDIDQFYKANMEILDRNPPINLYNPEWEIFTKIDLLSPAKLTQNSKADNSIISNGCLIKNAYIEKSIISYGVKILDESKIYDSILMGYNSIGKKVTIKNTIIDRGVSVPDGEVIGVDKNQDKKRGFTISDDGILVIPRKYKF